MVRPMQLEYVPKDNNWHSARRWRRSKHAEMIDKVNRERFNVFLASIKSQTSLYLMFRKPWSPNVNYFGFNGSVQALGS